MTNSSDNLIVGFLVASLGALILKPKKFLEDLQIPFIEGFGNVKNGGMNNISSVPLGGGGIRFGNTKEEFNIYQRAVNASIPSRQQLDSISNTRGGGSGLQAFSPSGGMDLATVDFGSEIESPVSPCAPSAPTWDSASLLPKSAGNGMKGFQFNEEQSALLASQSWLTAAERIGVNTTMGSLKNSSQDIRGDPFIIGMKKVSPWNNSVFYPDLTQRPLQGELKLDPSYKQMFNKNLGMFTS